MSRTFRLANLAIDIALLILALTVAPFVAAWNHHSAAIDADARRDTAFPSFWPSIAAVVFIATLAISAIYPMGVAP